MRQDERAPFVAALDRARVTAYPPGEFVGQESFMRAGEILDLARRAGVGPGVDVLDLCCGVAGPGRHVTQRLGCGYRGVDYSDSAVAIAADLAARAGLDCRFEVAHLPPVPGDDASADVVLLLETILAFEDKAAMAAEIARVLRPGGRLAMTLEEGRPLDAAERAAMPDADTVHLVPLAAMTAVLAAAGLEVTWTADHSAEHLAMVDALLAAFRADDAAIAEQVGRRALDELVAAHRLWSDWLRSGRVRKVALVARLP